MKEIFTFLVTTDESIKHIETWIDPDAADDVSVTLVNIAIASGVIFPLCRTFIEEEFKKSSGNLEGSIMRGNSVATKVAKAYINKIGYKYLQNLLGSWIHQVVVSERKKSYEIDPTKSESPEEVEKNKALLLEKTKAIIDHIISQNNIDNMPAEMRVLAAYFEEFAQKYAPKQTWALVGGFILLRWINPAIMTPEAYGLLPEGKVPSAKPRRNLVLVSKLIQNLSNGVEFGKKEQFMMPLNDFIRDYKPKMEKYLELVVQFTSRTSYTPVADPKALSVTDLHLLHRLFTQQTDKILASLSNPDDQQKFSKLVEKLGSYQSKISFSFLSANDRKAISALLEQQRDEALYIGVVDKKKRGKIQKRTLVVGHYRIYSFKPGGKLAREGHLLDLLEIRSSHVKELELQFKSFSIIADTEQADDIIYCIRRAFEDNFSGMPKKLQFKVMVEPSSRLEDVVNEDQEPCGGYISAYKALCNYYTVPPNEDVCWHFQYLPSRVKTFDLRRFMKDYSEHPLATLDLGPLFWALRFNFYFNIFYLKDYKLDKESFLDVVEMLKYNRTFESLVLSGVGGTKDGFLALFDALSLNKAIGLTNFDFSSNNIEDKGVTAFATYLQITPNNFTHINLDSTGATKHGLSALCLAIKDRAKVKGSSSLQYFSISDNKLATSSDSLAQMVSSCGLNLRTLCIANTSPEIDKITEALKKGSPYLQVLDLSRNKLKAADVSAISKYLEVQSSLTDINLSATKLPPDSLKELLCNVNSELKMSLADNSLGASVGSIIATIASKIQNIHYLDLSDNEMGEEGIIGLADGLRSNASIRTLIIDHNFKNSGKQRQAAVESLIKLISTNPHLESLSFVGKGSSALKADILPFLFALANNTSLTSLNITGHQMGDKGAVALSKALQINQTLSTLQWDENQTSLLGFLNVKKALKSNQALKTMPLPIADIGQALRSDSSSALQIQKALNKIERYLINNQQHSYS